eukprot:scaffold29781_cov70-Phaeocystis_antarctica.AAC.3
MPVRRAKRAGVQSGATEWPCMKRAPLRAMPGLGLGLGLELPSMMGVRPRARGHPRPACGTT